ncbi:hypothetical protein Mgra_00000468 [Meloidogyne graminicola]|uniref:Uncharacterized protein n=1 Tax=Meloidogyne graminicola TaxID=189291 RepID=A0A8T0A519_9BILA|nr:hypothetical protein Mgra_00000468 [Meloidogyne graminicola]
MKTKIINLFILISFIKFLFFQIVRRAMFEDDGKFLPHVRLAKDLVEKYDNRVRPVLNHSKPTFVNFTMSLYQILAINEKVQSVDLNLWIIQKWYDEFLGWNPNKYGGINDTILPHQKIWLPDTYLYNSMVMNREETERYINVVVSTEYWQNKKGAQVIFMYPALYRVSCRINILYFPYDQQNCTLIISSWTSDISSIDYQPDSNSVNLYSFIRNEEWEVVSFEIQRVVFILYNCNIKGVAEIFEKNKKNTQKFVCCPEPWVLLHASLIVRRKPLYYIVNLVLPTSVITLVAVTGFFTPASTSNERREKLSLGIDSLLAMSILMMMVSEQMPTTSDYLPLFGIFYLSIILIIFTGTLITAFVLNVHLQKIYNKPISPLISYIFFHKLAPWMGVRPSTVLLELWQETGLSNKLITRKVNKFIKNKSLKNNLSSIQDEIALKRFSTFNSLTNEQSIKARQNWKRITQLAYAKHKELIERGKQQLNNNNIYSDEIPFVDISPGRENSTNNNLLLLPYPSNFRKKEEYFNSFNNNLPPNKCPPPIPTKLKITKKELNNNNLNNSLNLLINSNETNSKAAILDLKLRRRFAYEWEFLATVLDRVLLIIFSGFVIFVTAAMIICDSNISSNSIIIKVKGIIYFKEKKN